MEIGQENISGRTSGKSIGTTCTGDCACKTSVLVICTANSARSQMAEGLIRHFRGDSYDVFSAGIKAGTLHPLAVRAMAEIGIDISQQRAKSVDELGGRHFDIIITVCDAANQNCPTFPGKSKRLHLGIPDPAAVKGTEEERMMAFRNARDELKKRILDLL